MNRNNNSKKRRWLKRLSVVLLIVLCMYVVLSPRCMPCLYEGLLFRPDLQCEANDHLSKTFAEDESFNCVEKIELMIDTQAGPLHAWWFKHEDSRVNRVILVYQGAAGNIPARALLISTLLKAGKIHGYSVLMYESRGFGQSGRGRPSIDSFMEDGLAVYDFVRKTHDPENIVVYGSSMGGAVATHVSTKRRVGGMILQSTFTSLADVAYERGTKEGGGLMLLLPWSAAGNLMFPSRVNNLGIVSDPSFNVPLLVLHGDTDDVVPAHHSSELFRAAHSSNKRLLILPESGHTWICPTEQPQFVEAIALFLDSLHHRCAGKPA